MLLFVPSIVIFNKQKPLLKRCETTCLSCSKIKPFIHNYLVIFLYINDSGLESQSPTFPL